MYICNFSDSVYSIQCDSKFRGNAKKFAELTHLADRNADRFAESAQTTDRNANHFANPMQFADHFALHITIYF